MDALQQLVDNVIRVKQEPEDEDEIVELSSDEEPSSSASSTPQLPDPSALLLNPALNLNPPPKARTKYNSSLNRRVNTTNEKGPLNVKRQHPVYGSSPTVCGSGQVEKSNPRARPPSFLSYDPYYFKKLKNQEADGPAKKIPKISAVEERTQSDPVNAESTVPQKGDQNIIIPDNTSTAKIPFYKKSQLNRQRMLPAILNELPHISQVVVAEKFLDIPNAPIFNRANANPKLPQLKKRLQKICPTDDFFQLLFPEPRSTDHIPRPYKVGGLFNLPEKEDLIPGVEMRLLVAPMDTTGVRTPHASGTEDGEYEVEKVLLKNVHVDKNPYYLLKWAGYGYGELSWESEASLDCTELVKEFHDRRNVCSIIYSNMSPEERENYPGFLTKYLHGMTDSLIMDTFILEGALDEFNKKNGFGKLIVENWTDDSELPLNWKPIPKNIHTNAVRMELMKTEAEKQCSCDQCSVSTCPCMTVRVQHGYIHANVNVITECNDLCDCKHCPPRAFNKGRQEPLILFKNRKSGFSVRALRDIREGRFVVEYVGIVKTVEECKDIEDVTYLFELDFSKNAKFVIDASEYGNEARFINHSCEPNLAVVMCFGAFGDKNMYKVYFFAARDIYAGEELTFNYFGSREVPTTDLPPNVPRCYCGSARCRKYLY